MTAVQQFDSTALIEFATGGMKVIVRFPSDVEFSEYVTAFQILAKPIRGANISRRVGGVEADRALVARVRQDNGTCLTGDQTDFIAKRLTDAGVVSKSEAAGSLLIVLRFLSDLRCCHTLRLPSQGQREAMVRAFRIIPASGGFSRYLVDYNCLKTLYEDLIISADGYLQGVPLIHKLRVVTEMSGYLLGGRNG